MVVPYPSVALDPATTSLVTVALANQAHHGHLDAWVWTYLSACLALSHGYEVARAVLADVREALVCAREAA